MKMHCTHLPCRSRTASEARRIHRQHRAALERTPPKKQPEEPYPCRHSATGWDGSGDWHGIAKRPTLNSAFFAPSRAVAPYRFHKRVGGAAGVAAATAAYRPAVADSASVVMSTAMHRTTDDGDGEGDAVGINEVVVALISSIWVGRRCQCAYNCKREANRI